MQSLKSAMLCQLFEDGYDTRAQWQKKSPKNQNYVLSEKMRSYYEGNGWIDKNGRPFNNAARDREEAKEMADNTSKALTYAGAACTLSAVCAPAAPIIFGAATGAGLAKEILDCNVTSFTSDYAIDKIISLIGGKFKIPVAASTVAGEQIKDNPSYDNWKQSKSMCPTK